MARIRISARRQPHLPLPRGKESPVPAVEGVLLVRVVVHPLAQVVRQVEGAVVVRAVLVVDRDHAVLQLQTDNGMNERFAF